ncbi:MAG: hypothetical protein K8I60_07250, partial [Anaerolineae bacterium]|nr:hypothetical protein [Anaerolineae bacterium]
MSAASEVNSTSKTPSAQRTQLAVLSNLISQRPGFLITLLLAVIATVVMLVFLVQALEWRTHPFLGVMVTPTMVVDGSLPISSDAPWSGIQAGLMRGDELISVNRVNLLMESGDYAAARANLRAIISGLKLNDRINVTFLRPAVNGGVNAVGTIHCDPVVDGSALCNTSYRVQPLPNSDFLAFFIVPYTVGVLTLVIGIAVLVLRPDQTSAQLVALMCITLAVFMGGAFDVNNTYVLPPLWLTAICYLSGILGALAIHYPSKAAIAYKYPAIELVPVVISSVFTGIVLYLFFNPSDPHEYFTLWQIAMVIDIVSVGILAGVLLRRRAGTPFPSVRDQTNTALIGIVLMAIPAGLWVISLVTQTMSGTPLFPLNSSTLMPFFILPSVGMAYGVLQYRQLDTEQIISRGITYILMLVALVASYALLVMGANFVTNEVVQANNPILIAGTIFLIAVLFLPVRTRLQRQIDQIYFRVRTSYRERTEQFGQRLTTLTNLDEIVTVFQEEVNATLQPERIFIFLLDQPSNTYKAFNSTPTDVTFDASSGLIARLQSQQDDPLIYLEKDRPWPPELVTERTRINILKTLVVVPLVGKDVLNGFIAFSRPRSGNGNYTSEEIRFIRN